uniref:Potassium channel domain-containing protein n=1 Tax=Panagrolaimus superbus TaxID=310955 RepID=A0A914YPP6_9BILA
MFRFCTLQSVSETETEERLDDSQLKHNPKNYRVSTAERLLLMPITVIVMALIGWISIGCLLCHLYNPNVDVHLLVYFVFNSLSTIGVGGIDLGG